MQDSGGPIPHDMNSPEMYATVFSLGPGKTDVNVIWAGSDDGLVHVTRDGGKTWANVTPKDLPDLGRVSQIDASAFDAGTAYIAVKKPRSPTRRTSSGRRLRQTGRDRQRHRAERLHPRGARIHAAGMLYAGRRRRLFLRRRRPLAVMAHPRYASLRHLDRRAT
jgi:hypothetical protein